MNAPPSPDERKRAGNLRGIFWMLGATLIFVNMHAAIRHIAPEVDPLEIAFFRNVLGLIFLAPVFLRYGLEPLRTTQFRMHFWRAAINLVNMVTYYMGLRLTPLAEATALNFTAPLFATVLATAFLGEKLRLWRALALAAGFTGALVIVRPGFEALNPGALLVIFSAVLWGGIMVMIKLIGRTESSLTITLWVLILMTAMSFPPALFVWQWPTATQFAWLTYIAVTGTIGQLMLAQALKEAEATAIMPVDFSRLIWAAVTGYFAFGEVPDVFTWTGGVMIFASATYIALREKKLHKRRESR
ncbi:MAG: DMT family transporter [Alphaproteobacteria bacterium]